VWGVANYELQITNDEGGSNGVCMAWMILAKVGGKLSSVVKGFTQSQNGRSGLLRRILEKALKGRRYTSDG